MEIIKNEDIKTTKKGRKKLQEPIKEPSPFLEDEEDLLPSLKDVICNDYVVESMKEFATDYFQHKEEMRKLGLHILKGIILYGYTGNGKTFLAKAVINDLIRHNPKLRYQYKLCVELKATSQAATIERIKDFFADIKAINKRDNKETVLVMDEIDSISGGRGTKSVINKVVTETLLQIEFGGDGVYIIGTTNLLHGIDSAILSRFKLFYVDFPNQVQRLTLLERLTKPIKIKDRHVLSKLAEKIDKWTIRDISKFCSGLYIEAKRKNITLDEKNIDWYYLHHFKGQTYIDVMAERSDYARRYKEREEQ